MAISEERFSAMENRMLEMCADIKVIKQFEEKHDRILFGNGGKEGIIVDIDRLKQHKISTEKTASVVWFTAIGLFCKTIWDIITNHK